MEPVKVLKALATSTTTIIILNLLSNTSPVWSFLGRPNQEKREDDSWGRVVVVRAMSIEILYMYVGVYVSMYVCLSVYVCIQVPLRVTIFCI